MRIIIDPDEAAKALELAFSDVIDQLKKARDDGLTVEINVLGAVAAFRIVTRTMDMGEDNVEMEALSKAMAQGMLAGIDDCCSESVLAAITEEGPDPTPVDYGMVEETLH